MCVCVCVCVCVQMCEFRGLCVCVCVCVNLGGWVCFGGAVCVLCACECVNLGVWLCVCICEFGGLGLVGGSVCVCVRVCMSV